MTDTVDTNVIFNGNRKYNVQLLNTSDGTGESAVVKVDISGLTGLSGVAPSKLVIEWAEWAVQGFTSVLLAFDATTDDPALRLSGVGFKDFREGGGLVDPASTGATGDLLLSTVGAVSGATYDITLMLRLKD